MSTRFACWQCGEPLTDMILPVSRREECAACRAEIHVCRMCIHFDHGATRCREERAEDVSDAERANFCDYFAPSEDAFDRRQAKPDANAELEALFGGPKAEGDAPKNPLDDLFK